MKKKCSKNLLAQFKFYLFKIDQTMNLIEEVISMKALFKNFSF